jgi:hypothetical protein
MAIPSLRPPLNFFRKFVGGQSFALRQNFKNGLSAEPLGFPDWDFFLQEKCSHQHPCKFELTAEDAGGLIKKTPLAGEMPEGLGY